MLTLLVEIIGWIALALTLLFVASSTLLLVAEDMPARRHAPLTRADADVVPLRPSSPVAVPAVPGDDPHPAAA